MFKFLKSVFEPLPKYRLVPDKDGTYTLERLDSLVGYLCVAVRVTPKEADKVIKNLEGEILYYRK